jgi:hypothetical protein
MRRNTGLAVLAIIALALALTGWLGSGGSAQTRPATPPRQELAKRLLETRGLQFTPPARSFLARVASGGERGVAPEAAAPKASTGAATTATGAAVAIAGRGLPNVRVNDPARDRHQQDQTTQSETSIAVAGRNVAVGYNDSQNSLLAFTQATSLTGYSYSRDGGRTFTDGGPLPNAPGYVNLGDPWLTSDRAGRMYYATLAITPNYNLGVSVARSTSGGRRWSNPVKVSPGDPPIDFYFGDKPAMTAGRDPARPGRDVLYVAWDDFFFGFEAGFEAFTGLPVARSTDGGRTWTVAYAARHSLFDEGCSFTQYLGAQPIVDPASGTLYVAAERFQINDPQCRGGELVTSEVIFKSTNGGRSFGPEVKIADITPAGPTETLFGPAILLGPGKAMRTAEFPVLAFHQGSLYVAWNEGAGGHSHLRLAKSTNGGASWSVRWLTGGSRDEAQPALSSDREGLHVLFYSIAPRGPNRLLDVAVLDSRDGARFRLRRITNRSFPGVLNVKQFDPLIIPFYMGDYIANVSDGRRQYFAWGDNRDRVRNWLYPGGRHDPNVYFARR